MSDDNMGPITPAAARAIAHEEALAFKRMPKVAAERRKMAQVLRQCYRDNPLLTREMWKIMRETQRQLYKGLLDLAFNTTRTDMKDSRL